MRSGGAGGFEADVDGTDTAHDIVITAIAEAGVLHHALEGVLIRMHANGFRQIAIAL